MLELVVPFSDVNSPELGTFCLKEFKLDEGQPCELQLNCEHVSYRSLARKLNGEVAFDLECELFELLVGAVRNHNLSFINISNVPHDRESSWVRHVAEHSTLISARRFDQDYHYWQNADAPGLYQAHGRSIEGLPLRHNGFPPPYGEYVIDTTQNPGRRILREGFIEAVGNRMWLGSEFFRRVPDITEDTILADPRIRIEKGEDGVLELVAQEEPFVDDSSAERQEYVRRLLFGALCDKRAGRDIEGLGSA